ncbi:MAG: xylulokinase [bacterium]
MKYFLGIDIGTTGLKALLIDGKGRIAGSAREEYPLSTPKPGWAEQAPDIWWKATASAVRKLMAGGADASKIAAVGLSGQMHGLVPLDSADKPLRPAILWCDQRPVKECDTLQKKFADRLIKTASNPALTGFTAPKILWMKKNESDLYKKMSCFLLPKDYVRFKLTGERAIDISDAAGTLMLNVAKGEWAADLIRDMGIKTSILPPIVGSSEIAGLVTREAARLTGLREGTPVVGGGADNTCAAIGTGIVRPSRVSSSIGSSGVIFAHTDKLRVDPSARVHSFNHSVPGKFYLMGVMLSAGLSFKWFRDTFCEKEIAAEKAGGGDAYDLLSREAQKAAPCCEGLLFLPYLNGERTPHKDPFARGVFFGISPRHNRAHMVRSVMEGIVYGLKDSLDIMESMGIKVEQVRATGGGGKNAFWRQMQADMFGKPVVTVNHDEGPAYGAALLAASGAGAFKNVVEAADATVRVTSTTKPNPAMTKKYGENQARFKSLYSALEDEFKAIKY